MKPIAETITLATLECIKSVEEILNKYNLPASIGVMIVDKLKADLLENKVQEVIIMHKQEEEKIKQGYEEQIDKLQKDLDVLRATDNLTAKKAMENANNGKH